MALAAHTASVWGHAHEDTLLRRLLDSAEASYDLSVSVRAARRARFDYLACAAAGAREAPAALGPAGRAAFGDLDDIHWPSMTHLGAIVWATAELAGAGDERLWLAAHMGYEIGGRLGLALGSEHRRYWHATATAGTVAAAVTAAFCIGADPVRAAAHALSVAGGSILCILEYTDTRVLHRDHAVASGLRCAELAELSAAEDTLEHPRGFIAATGGSAAGLDGPRPRTVLEEVSFRRHATSGFNQAAVDVASEFEPIDVAAQAGEILLDVPDATAALAGISNPRTAREAWWSCQHAVAATLLGRDLAVCAVDDSAVSSLRARIRLRGGSPVTRLTLGGRVVERERADPLSDADLVAKWRRLVPDLDPPLEMLA